MIHDWYLCMHLFILCNHRTFIAQSQNVDFIFQNIFSQDSYENWRLPFLYWSYILFWNIFIFVFYWVRLGGTLTDSWTQVCFIPLINHFPTQTCEEKVWRENTQRVLCFPSGDWQVWLTGLIDRSDWQLDSWWWWWCAPCIPLSSPTNRLRCG